MQRVYGRMVEAHEGRKGEQEADLDAAFHMAIIEAGHNIIMLHMMRSMYDLFRRGVFYNRQVMFDQHTTRRALLDQHGAINAAIQARNAEGAQAAVAAHLNYVEQALAGHMRAERNEAVASARLKQENRR